MVKLYPRYALVLVFLMMVPSCLAYAEEKPVEAKSSQTLKSQFIGTWKLVSVDARRPNGEAAPNRYSANPAGYLIYDATGHMAVQLMSPGRPRFVSGDVEQGTPEEIKAAFDGYGAYFGTYEINEGEHFVIHHVEGSLFPNNIGTDQKRFFELSGDQLVLKPPPRQAAGEQQTLRITWQRVK